jgi:hypothetical protein
MRKIILAAVLLSNAALLWAGAAPNPAEYTLNVHVTSERFDVGNSLRLNVTIDGKKYELQALDGETPLFALGDYKAKTLAVKAKDAHLYDIYGRYEFLFPDNKIRDFNLVGITE